MSLNSCSYHKWRCLIALANVDARLDPNEKKFFSEQLNNLKGEGISREQMETLSHDLKNPMQPEVFFIRIDDPLEKLDLLRMAYFLFMSDDDFEIREQQVYEDLRQKISKSLNIEEDVLDKVAKIKSSTDNPSLKKVFLRYLGLNKIEADDFDEIIRPLLYKFAKAGQS